MKVYVYQAALLCEECGREAREYLKDSAKAPADANDESSYDSGDFPKGPYSNGGGEADCPQQCDHCGKFLGNPLTTDGVEYVRHAVEEARRAPLNTSVALSHWAPFYGIRENEQ